MELNDYFHCYSAPDCIRPVHCIHKMPILFKAAGFPIIGSGYDMMFPLFSMFRTYQGTSRKVEHGRYDVLCPSPNCCRALQGGAALGFSTAWWALNRCLPTVCPFRLSSLHQALFHVGTPGHPKKASLQAL